MNIESFVFASAHLEVCTHQVVVNKVNIKK